MATGEEDDLAGVFDEIQRGDPDAEAHLFARVYDMLGKMAHRRLAGEPPDATLQTTTLVH